MNSGTNHLFAVDHWYNLSFHDVRHREEAGYQCCGERVELDFLALGGPPLASPRQPKACVTLRLGRDRTPADTASRALLACLGITAPVPPEFDWATHLAARQVRGRFGPPARSGGRNPLESLRSDATDEEGDRATDPALVGPTGVGDAPSRRSIGTRRVAPAAGDIRPRWDGANWRLYRGQERILVYKRSAKSQAKILASFEELGWPERIDDPLKFGQLRNTLRDLQRACKREGAPIRFARGGDGTSIVWAWSE